MGRNLPTEFLSCDWGTSRFRLRLVETATLKVLDEIVTDGGVASLGKSLGEANASSRFQRFKEYLIQQAKHLDMEGGGKKIVVVVSGMASSSIGMKELPYVALPFGGSSRELLCERFEIAHTIDLILVSGICSKTGVMRGEEVQAVGLAEQIIIEQPGVLILPGTHSKHLRFSNGQYRDIRTFMSGELFETLRTHTILAESVHVTALDKQGEKAFLEGVRLGAAEGLQGSLFAVRSGVLLGHRDKASSAHFLSGLLLGSELVYLRDHKEPVWLAAPEILSYPYRLALSTLLPGDRIHVIASTDLERPSGKEEPKRH